MSAINADLELASIATVELDVADGMSLVPTNAYRRLHGLGRAIAKETCEQRMRRIHADDRERVQRIMAAAVEGTDDFVEFEYRIVLPADGSMRWIVSRLSITRSADGRALRFVGADIDITSRKHLEVTLPPSEVRLRVLADAVPLVIWTSTPEGVANFFNKRWYEYSGLSLDQTSGYGWQAIVHPDDAPASYQRWETALERGEVFDTEFRLRGGDAAYRWFVARNVPVRDADSHVQGWFGTATEIDQFKHPRAEAHDSEAPVCDIMAPIFGPTFSGAITVQRDTTDVARETDMLRESEVRYRALAEDLSRTQEALLTADRQKDQFLATLAHELRNPLAPVASAMQLISLRGSTDPQVLWALDVVNRQTHNMTRLIDDLMDVSRISQNKLVLRIEPVDLVAVLRDAMDISRPLMQRQGQQMTVDLPHEPVILDGDATRLAQVFANLLDNAVKYTEAGGALSLTARFEGAEVVVSVRDTGIGIAPEHTAHIFELFSQVRASQDRAKGGLGIGLALAKQLVHLHGGTISVQSEGEGQGSEFVVRLPRASAAASVPPAIPSEDDVALDEASAMLAGVRVLIVDDNADAADVFDALLSHAGSNVRVAYDGAAALAVAEEFQPQIVLMDIGLPKLTGHEVAEHIRAESWGARMILIAISGWGTEDEKRKSYAAGFDRHLVKPVEPRRLISVIGELLRSAMHE
jgi:PAS domain S-box-containing protein